MLFGVPHLKIFEVVREVNVRFHGKLEVALRNSIQGYIRPNSEQPIRRVVKQLRANQATDTYGGRLNPGRPMSLMSFFWYLNPPWME